MLLKIMQMLLKLWHIDIFLLMNIYYLHDKKKIAENQYFSSELCFSLLLIIYFAPNTLVH